MSSTTVHSNNQEDKYTPSVAGTIFAATENTLEVPPQGQVYEVISSYIEEKGNMEIIADTYEADRDDNKKVMTRVDKNGKLLSMTNRKLTDEEVKYIIGVHPVLAKVLGNRKTAKATNERGE